MHKLTTLQHHVEELKVAELLMYEQSHHKSYHVCEQLHTLIVCKLYWLVDLSHNIGQDVAHVLIMHQRQEVPLLFDPNGL